MSKDVTPEFSLWIFEMLGIFELFIDKHYEKYIQDHNPNEIKDLIHKVDQMFNDISVYKIQYLILENEQEIDSDIYFNYCDEILHGLIKYINKKKEEK